MFIAVTVLAAAVVGAVVWWFRRDPVEDAAGDRFEAEPLGGLLPPDTEAVFVEGLRAYHDSGSPIQVDGELEVVVAYEPPRSVSLRLLADAFAARGDAALHDPQGTVAELMDELTATERPGVLHLRGGLPADDLDDVADLDGMNPDRLAAAVAEVVTEMVAQTTAADAAAAGSSVSTTAADATVAGAGAGAGASMADAAVTGTEVSATGTGAGAGATAVADANAGATVVADADVDGTAVSGADGLGGTAVSGADGLGGTAVSGADGLGGTAVSGADGLGGTAVDGADGLGGTAVSGAEGWGLWAAETRLGALHVRVPAPAPAVPAGEAGSADGGPDESGSGGRTHVNGTPVKPLHTPQEAAPEADAGRPNTLMLDLARVLDRCREVRERRPDAPAEDVLREAVTDLLAADGPGMTWAHPPTPAQRRLVQGGSPEPH
ncbi:hypothetical protein AB0K18_07165 [Nonomuraea sp. NPDC049421]|uniref:hypothetical protein n=1 Tax=Nonomuraea sp. NPDC049421 TaxID=3155275 RepID=UPI0034496B46